MKLGVFTTTTNPVWRGDNIVDALNCYDELADEVVMINGAVDSDKRIEIDRRLQLDYLWPQEFSWEFIGQQFQRGYEACTGDWVVRMDIDCMFHENDFEALRGALKQADEGGMVAVT